MKEDRDKTDSRKDVYDYCSENKAIDHGNERKLR